MTFPEYFQACQSLITKEIDLPFDCPFTDDWLNAHNAEFSMFEYAGLTPEKAVKMHFERIGRVALLMAKRRKSKSKI